MAVTRTKDSKDRGDVEQASLPSQTQHPYPSSPLWQRLLLWGVLLVYPLIHAFFGLDLAQTGYDLFRYEYFLSRPELVDLSPILALFVGRGWGLLFGNLGILAFNLLTVLFEWGTSLLIFQMSWRRLGRRATLIGLLMGQLMLSTYYNAFSYQHLSVFLIVLLLFLQYHAIQKQKLPYSAGAGIVFALALFTQPWNGIAIIALVVYFVEGYRNPKESSKYNSKDKKFPFVRHLLVWLLGAALTVLTFLGILKGVGLYTPYLEDLRFFLQSARSSLRGLIENFLFSNLKAIGSGLIFFMAGLIFLLSLNHSMQAHKRKLHRLFGILVGAFCMLIALYLMLYSWDITPDGNAFMRTLGFRFVLGVLYMVGFFLYFAYFHRTGAVARGMRVHVFSAFVLPLTIMFGQYTGTKHSLIAYSLFFPLAVYLVRYLWESPRFRQKMNQLTRRWRSPTYPSAVKGTIIVLVVMFLVKYATMIPYTFAYDRVNPFSYRETIDHPKLQGIRVPWNQKNEIEKVLKALDDYDPESEKPLHVFGSSVLFHYLEDREPYGNPYPTRNQLSRGEYHFSLLDSMAQFGNDNLPIIIFGRTNTAYDFRDDDRMALAREIEKRQFYAGKKNEFISFVRYFNYGVYYESDYYLVLVPFTDMKPGDTESLIRG